MNGLAEVIIIVHDLWLLVNSLAQREHKLFYAVTEVSLEVSYVAYGHPQFLEIGFIRRDALRGTRCVMVIGDSA